MKMPLLRNKFMKFAIAAVIVAATSSIVFGRTLNEYRDALEAARKSAESLAGEFGATSTGKVNETNVASHVAAIRERIPAREKIEYGGVTVETDNNWIHQALDAIGESEAPAERQKIALAVFQRVESVEQKINDILNGTANSGRSKDDDKSKLGEILRRPEFSKPEEKKESWFQRIQRAIAEWFNRKMPQGPSIPSGAKEGISTLSTGMQVLLYVVILGFIAFLIYRFAPFFAERLKRRQKKVREDRVVLGETIAADADAQTLFDEAEALARAGNLRAAVRKGYIASLCELSDLHIIGLARHKTNRDYLRDLRRREPVFGPMRRLTESFERHWYGFEDVDDTSWNEFKRLYQEALRGARN